MKKIDSSEIMDQQYLMDLCEYVEEALGSSVESCTVDRDDENAYFIITHGSDVYEFKVPYGDLSMVNLDKDSSYISRAISDELGLEEVIQSSIDIEGAIDMSDVSYVCSLIETAIDEASYAIDSGGNDRNLHKCVGYLRKALGSLGRRS